MPFDLKQLRSFAVVAEEGNLSRAATRLHVSQPALSRRIRELEQGLDLELFEHVDRGLRLTGPGEVFLGRCRDLVAHADALEEHVGTLASGDVGVLRVGASPPILELLFPELLTRYRRTFPDVDVQLVENGGIDLLRQLERGEVHLAVSSFPAGEQFESRLLRAVPIVGALAPSHRLSGSDAVQLDELSGEPLLLLRRGFYTRDAFDGACRLAHVEPHVVVESAAPQTLLALAEADLGVAVIPSTVRLDPYSVSVRPIVRGRAPLQKRLSINWARERHLPRYAEAFVDELAAVAEERLALGRAAELAG